MHCLGALLLLLLPAGCGGDGGTTLRVSAASSLRTALVQQSPGVAFSFAGSDALAAQIRSGARPDVFAAADAQLPQQLFAEGLAERPVAFATNRLVLAVPPDSGRVGSLDDLGPRTKLALGAAGVPVGAYARAALGRLPAARRDAILAGVRTEEPDVAGIVGKVAQGAVDAGFVYATDVTASAERLRAIELPRALQPQVVYAAVVVKGARDVGAARAFVRALPRSRALRRAGFGPPP
jgi:molybdate transport system substrate-binding protein